MRYLALACDYDGTLATSGRVSEATLRDLQLVRASGRRVLLVTGRELEDLLAVFPAIDVCDIVVAENGGLLYRPSTREHKSLGAEPPPELIRELQARKVPLSVGRSIVATWEPHESTALAVIRDLGLEWQVIFNKGAVMMLPSGVNKATGIAVALTELELSRHNTAGIGDAENDHAFLRFCECAAAVANALPMVKEQADVVMPGENGTGVGQLIRALLEDDLRQLEPRLTRHHVLVGMREDGQEVRVAPYGESLLLAGTSGSGKSTLATGLLERMAEQGYQFCVIDPEGDYANVGNAIVLGDANRAPGVEEVLQLLKNPATNAVVNVVSVPLGDRPAFFVELLPRLQEFRARTGRPHCLLVDEAHHVLPSTWKPQPLAFPLEIMHTIFVTVHPDAMALAPLKTVRTVIAFGNEPDSTLRDVAKRLDLAPEQLSVPPSSLAPGEALFWRIRDGVAPVRVRIAPGQSERLRHRRKYAEGDLGIERSFYFTGREGKLKLRAQNLIMFIQLAEGVDDETWMYHLHRHDYSRWFRDFIKDETLAEEASRIEELKDPKESRQRLKALVSQHYTLPATPAAPLAGGRSAKT